MSEENQVPQEEVQQEAPVQEAVATEETVDEAVEETTEEVVEDAPFSWDDVEGGAAAGNKDREALTALYEETLGSSIEHQVVEGKVTAKTDREVIIDINSKSEGVVSLNEFRYNPELAVGDAVEVLVDRQEDKNGQLVLSHRKARSIKAWDRVNEAHENDEIVKGYVKARTKGGMIVDVFGLEAFLPGSQIDVKPIRDYDQYVDKTMEFKVVKINHEFKNVVVSHKALIEADLEEQKKEIISKLEKGQVLEGVVKNITSYGVFIDLGGVDGLVHITDLSWSRINHPSEVVELDQKINVVILDFDEGKTRIQLGLKQLEKHPWDALDANLAVGDTVKGKVVVLADYGAFVEVLPGVEGLIHVSEMSWSAHLRSAGDFMKVGDEVDAQVLTLDREERKMSLGIKQMTTDPWTDITTKYPQGSQHKGTVRNFTNFGIFLELEEGIDGLIHISDLSWTKKVKHPSEFTSIGATLEVVVLDIDAENRRLSLGHKQLENNPWDDYAKAFEVGSTHTGTMINSGDKGGDVSFASHEGVEAYCPARHITKEEGGKLEKGETAEFKVIEFNKDNRRIVVSHVGTYKEVEVKKGRSASSNKGGGNMVSASTSTERATMGDLDALAALKEQMDNENK
ncbi:MAG: 30S ribosomal protein S1 [Flavobacteriia bacterium]|nr:30S ribosomal protein S1 [Flavobacteriia bacterium]